MEACLSFVITLHDKLTRLPLFHLKSVILDHLIAKNATAPKVNSYYTLAISYCTFCVGKHTILGPVVIIQYNEAEILAW